MQQPQFRHLCLHQRSHHRRHCRRALSLHVLRARPSAPDPADAAAFATAFANVAQYTNTSTGTAPGPNLPSGYYASSTEINTLGNILAACVNSTGGSALGSNSSDGTACGNLFNLTRSAGVAPTNTVNSLINILNNPTQNVSSLFSLPQPIAPFQPSLSVAPSTWALPILQMAATPTFSIAGGTYSSAQFVILSDTTSGAVIHYTVDGSTPTSASPIASGTITVSSSQTINAIAQAGGFATSAVASAAYTITGSTSTYTVNGQIIIPNCGVSSIPPVTVTLTHGSVVVQTTTTNTSGNYSFSGVPAGTYTVTPSIVGPSAVFYPSSQTTIVNNSFSIPSVPGQPWLYRLRNSRVHRFANRPQLSIPEPHQLRRRRNDRNEHLQQGRLHRTRRAARSLHPPGFYG